MRRADASRPSCVSGGIVTRFGQVVVGRKAEGWHDWSGRRLVAGSASSAATLLVRRLRPRADSRLSPTSRTNINSAASFARLRKPSGRSQAYLHVGAGSSALRASSGKQPGSTVPSPKPSRGTNRGEPAPLHLQASSTPTIHKPSLRNCYAFRLDDASRATVCDRRAALGNETSQRRKDMK